MKRRQLKSKVVFFLTIFLLFGSFTFFDYQVIKAAETYSVDYTQNDWGSGATVSITITNNSTSAIDGWTLEWDFPGNQEISNMWNADFTQDGTTVSTKNMPYNSGISANGGTVSFGFNLIYSGSNTAPTSFVFNGNTIGIPVDPVDPIDISKYLLIGRFDTSDEAGPKSAWSAGTIKANFQGTGISVTMKSGDDNWFNVIIDNQVMSPVNITASTAMPVVLATGLNSGSHTIELVRRTEAWLGDVQFLGFTVEDGELLDPPAASARRIEFIGDSITCGYGNEGTSQYQSFTPANENAYMAYGSITARLLEADQFTVAWSGKGVIRNYGGSTEDILPELYNRVLPYDETQTWDTSKWIPHVVVINLCTNDFSIGIPDQSTFVSAYIQFVEQIRSQYSDAHIYCALGPMLNGENLVAARDYISEVVNHFITSGDTTVHFIEFPMQDGTLGYGEDWHPSVATHELMASQLAQQIKDDLGW